jgi:hypothetical protein
LLKSSFACHEAKTDNYDSVLRRCQQPSENFLPVALLANRGCRFGHPVKRRVFYVLFSKGQALFQINLFVDLKPVLALYFY